MSTVSEPRRITKTPAALRVLAAAERLFYARGIHAVGVDLIAAEAGVTKKTLYDRFGSKEQIVVEYLAGRDERWRAFLDELLDAAPAEPRARVLAVFDASLAWTRSQESQAKGCGMINAHAEISDASHPAYPIIIGQKQWMLALFTRLAEEVVRGGAEAAERAVSLGRSLMLLHEGAFVAHGLGIFPDPLGRARAEAERLLTEAAGA
ncbi:helix-turn-helix domain containing protein [Streptomyces sp. ME02-6978a]|uniref:TetR/AcrR family transcriptional regulator n=1 Tax=Streptomyces TaxID=1883 RepID=UPI0029A925AB|nr:MULTISPECIES: helix-turn-helix domain-containing protein [unclassified Streptomyces]MDX3089832.1 helix-turn-helix domain containing protein [Streptomyces sp. ME12-02E]MDX3333516.1 helix-turn-helix domain containing protein [Streptomyces sp. ME02-6978a]